MKYIYAVIILCFTTLTYAQQRGFTIGKKDDGTPEKRLALIVGNKDYVRADSQLDNPVNDAKDMAEALFSAGFDTLLVLNATQREMKRVVDNFGSKLDEYDVALFYYSGHGIQYNQENYLVPVDASLTEFTDIEYDCVALGRIMGKMKSSNAKSNIVILDACRDNPFAKSNGSKGAVGKGLVIPNNPAGTVVIFATEEGSTADDYSNSKNGLFTGELLKYIVQPDLSISDIVTRTRNDVYTKSNGKQLPSEYNKMLGDFYFLKTDTELLESYKAFDGQFQQGITAAEGNNRSMAKEIFEDLVLKYRDNTQVDKSVYETQAQKFYDRAMKFYEYEEFQIAKEWFELAVSLNNSDTIRSKIKDCNEKI